MRPIDVPTNEVFQLVSNYLPVRPARILEIGCGSGALAAQLTEAGHKVVAIDPSEDAIRQAQARGVDAHLATWPDFEDAPFDAILFTRSLHHIAPLEPALDRVTQMLRPGGVVMVEDFDFTAARRAEVAWLYGALNLLRVCNRLHMKEGLTKNLLDGGGDYSLWQRGGDMHPVSVMQDALVARFDLIADESPIALYRFAMPMLPDDEEGYALADALLTMETQLAEAGAIVRIGRWFVGRQKK